jgi:hypothetical protein
VRGQAEQFLRLLLEVRASGRLDVASGGWAARRSGRTVRGAGAQRLHVSADRNLHLFTSGRCFRFFVASLLAMRTRSRTRSDLTEL